METAEKKIIKIEEKKQKHYEKKPLGFSTIHVDNYISFVSQRREDPNLQLLLLKYLRSHSDAEFGTLEEICEAIRTEYNYRDDKFNKTAMSKVLKNIHGDLIFSDGIYYFQKVQGSYKLRHRYLRDDPHLVKLYKMKNTFMKDAVHCIDSYTIVFTINPDHADTVKSILGNYLGSEACYGIMVCGSYLVVMLNRSFPKVSLLRNALLDFFKNKTTYQNKLKVQPKCKTKKAKVVNIGTQKNDTWSGS